MPVLRPLPTGNLADDLKQYMERERELGAWGFAHLVRYLRAIILALNPQPHRCTRAVLDAATQALATNAPMRLQHLYTMPPEGVTRAVAARCVANHLIEVVDAWAGWRGKVKFRDRGEKTAERFAYEHARVECEDAQTLALNAGLTVTELYECGTAAFGDQIDPERRDAAVAAFSAGHFQLGQELLIDD